MPEHAHQPQVLWPSTRLQKTMTTLRSRIHSSLQAAGACGSPSRRIRIEIAIHHLGEFLEHSPEVQITLSDVAELACLEKTYCCKLFGSITGLSFRDWLRRLRIRKAAILLRTVDNSITEVAHAVGYADLTTFERNFQQEVGMCPTAYRRHQAAA